MMFFTQAAPLPVFGYLIDWEDISNTKTALDHIYKHLENLQNNSARRLTVEAPVRDNLVNSKKMVVTRPGRLQEYALVSDPMVKQ